MPRTRDKPNCLQINLNSCHLLVTEIFPSLTLSLNDEINVLRSLVLCIFQTVLSLLFLIAVLEISLRSLGIKYVKRRGGECRGRRTNQTNK